MFNYDDFDDFDSSSLTIMFDYHRVDNNLSTAAKVTHYVRDHKAEHLPHILDAFRSFLKGAGFEYVEEIVAVKSSGDETSSAEVIF